MSDHRSEFDCLVVGAGMAGLSAAHALAKIGKRVALLEARSRVGGRIHSIRAANCDLPVELGAEFIHGRAPELLELASAAGASIFELDGQTLCRRGGRLEDCGFDDDDFSILRKLPENPDLSFAEWMAQERSSAEAGALASVAGYVEGFNAADLRIIGTRSLVVQQRAEDSIEGDRLFRAEEGYSAIAEHLARQFRQAGGSIFLSTVVRSVEWRPNSVHIEIGPGNAAGNSERETCFIARQCLITLPLGVLQAGAVHFNPIPERPLDAAKRLAMGSATRIVLVFRERFWAAAHPDASFLLLGDTLPATWWTPAPKTAPMLTGWIGGPRARHPAVGTERSLLEQSLSSLSRAFALPAEKIQSLLLSWHTHNWQRDEFSRGAYSYVPKGALDAISSLAEPLENTLFFAGEHTDGGGHWGTVYGALRSGVRAARQMGA